MSTRTVIGCAHLFGSPFPLLPAVDESLDYLHFLVPYEREDQLPLLLAFLKARVMRGGIGYPTWGAGGRAAA